MVRLRSTENYYVNSGEKYCKNNEINITLQINKLTNNNVVPPSHMMKLKKCQEKYRNDTLYVGTHEKR